MSLIEKLKADKRFSVSIALVIVLMLVVMGYSVNTIGEGRSTYNYQSEIRMMEQRMESRYKDFTDDVYNRLDRNLNEQRQGFYMDNRRIESLENRVKVLESMTRGNTISIQNSSSSNIFRELDSKESK